MLAVFRELDNDTLKRHVGEPGSDGAGTLRILCGCRNGYSPEAWMIHIRAVVTSARSTANRT